MKTLKLLFLSLLVLAIVMPTSVFAKDTDKAGKVTTVAGKAEVKKGGGSKKFNAFKGMAITQGDTIITGSDGKITMDLDSDKQVTIGTNTTLIISELVQSAKALGGKTSLSLLKGKVLITIKKKLEGDSRFEIETPTAIMGVMGTEFTVEYEDDVSYVGVFEGAVKTKHGEKLADETVVRPNEQMGLDEEGAGNKEKLDYLDLPLVGLEHYLALLQKDAKADKALIEKVKQQIAAKKQEEAAEAANDNGSTPANTNIVYEDGTGTSGGNGSVAVPTPTVTPTPTPTASPSVTEAPTPTPTATTPVETEAPSPTATTPTPVPPVLDVNALYNNLQKYMIDAKTFTLPFTASIAYNGVNIAFPSDGSQVVKFEIYNTETHQFESDHIGLSVSVDTDNDHLLVIKRAEAVPYNAKILLTVLGGTIKNAETNDIQTEDQITVDAEIGPGFVFKFENESYSSEYNHVEPTEDGEGMVVIELPTLGYQFNDIAISRVCPEEEGEGQESPPCYTDLDDELSDYVTVDELLKSVTITLNISKFQALDPGMYQVRVNFRDASDNLYPVDFNINIKGKQPPEADMFNAYMKDDYSIILPFTTDLAGSIANSDISVITLPDLFLESPFQEEGYEQEVEDLEVESVMINPSDAAQLIVTLQDPVEYGSWLGVTIAPNVLRNAETGDVQNNVQDFFFEHKFTLSANEVEFMHGNGSFPDQEIIINTFGHELGQFQLTMNCIGDNCGGFEPPSDLGEVYALAEENDLIKLTLKGSYFSSEYVNPGWYELTIPILRDDEQIDEIRISIAVNFPLV
ncbi:FecR family protein [Candidatus Pristimantibacillus sp. PTI5]|uniref:FecR family protein n=1 Tax=Candidatus Pristimantibacillus sp. PTI5 TaxID=3400422 RepID=UPI003B0289EC